MHIHKNYKTDFKKYCKSDVEKCMSVSIEIKRSDRADLVDMCPDYPYPYHAVLNVTTINISKSRMIFFF